MSLFRLVFKVVFSFWHSKSLSQFRRSEPSSLLSFGVQSHHRFSVSTFKAIIASQFRRSEPSSLLSFDVQSHYRFSVPTFRAVVHSLAFKVVIHILMFRVTSSIWNLELSFVLSSTFRVVIISSQQGIKSHHLSTVWHLESSSFILLAFKVISPQPCRSESLSLHSLAFRVTVPFIVWHSELSSYHDRAFIATFLAFRATFLVFRAIIHSLEFKAVVHSWSLESSYLQFGIQSHQSAYHSEPPFSSSSAFKATFLAFKVVFFFQFSVQRHITSIQDCHFLLVQHLGSFLPLRVTSISFRRSEPRLQFGIQSHHLLQFGVQSRVFVLAFRAIVQLSIQCHHLPLVLAFRAIVHTHSGIQSHHLSSFWRSESFLLNLVIQSHGS